MGYKVGLSKWKITIYSILLLSVTIYGNRISIDLSGSWEYQLDWNDEGVGQSWFSKNLTGSGFVLPGTTNQNKVGTPFNRVINSPNIENLRKMWPKFNYVNPAWYQRQIFIPENFNGKNINLYLERVMYESRVWIDNNEVGIHAALSTPHIYDITQYLQPGSTHRLTIRIDNRDKHSLAKYPLANGTTTHAYGPETQTIWNGIIGELKLILTDKISFDEVQVYPVLAEKKFSLKIYTKNHTNSSIPLNLFIQARSSNTNQIHTVPVQSFSYSSNPGKQENSFDFMVGDGALLWDEFNPAIYSLTLTMSSLDGIYTDQLIVTAGMRELKVSGSQFSLNNKKIFLRGTLDACVFPLTGYPPTDPGSWKKVFNTYKEYGINHIRFHSWCPPKAAFDAADSVGIYLQPEGPMWINVAGVDPIRNQFFTEEGLRILDTYGNHASFCLYSNGNEVNSGWDALNNITMQLKNRDSRHLYALITGRNVQNLSQSDFVVPYDGRQHFWGHGDYSHLVNKYGIPMIHHEIGQWFVFPNVDEISKYDGLIRPFNYEVIKEDLIQKNLYNQLSNYVMGSGKLSVLLYKGEMETSLKTPGFGGYQLLGLQDYPGYGLATDGILDLLLENKGIITPSEFKRFNDSTVLLINGINNNYVYRNSEPLRADVLISHFGKSSLVNANVNWKLSYKGDGIIQQGSINGLNIPIGSGISLGTVNVALSNITSASQVTLSLSLGGTNISNSWNFWIYPEILPISESQLLTSGNILIDDTYTKSAHDHLEAGGKVLILPDKEDLSNSIPGRFKSIFWAVTLWGGGALDFPSGIYAKENHPIFNEFPTAYHTDFQWQDLLDRSNTMIIDDLPMDSNPIISVIPNGLRNRRMSNLMEMKVGSGKLIICSIDLKRNLNTRPSATQLRNSILTYMANPNFNPTSNLLADDIIELFSNPGVLGNSLIVDNSDNGFSKFGNWINWVGNQAYKGDLEYSAMGNGSNYVTFTPNIRTTGYYSVMARWTSTDNRATNAPFIITHSGGIDTIRVNQQLGDGVWNTLGTFSFTSGTSGNVRLSNEANQYVIADAVYFKYVGDELNINPSKIAKKYDKTYRVAGGFFVFPEGLAGKTKFVSIYNYSGKLMYNTVTNDQVIDFERTIGLPNNLYIVRVKVD